jgi:hypothetical protein
MTEHHEATVELSGAGNEAPVAEETPEPVEIQLDQVFADRLGNAMDVFMTTLDALREDYKITKEQYPGVLYHLTTDIPSTYMGWLEYKADPEAYLAAEAEALAAQADDDGVVRFSSEDVPK